MCNPPDMNQRLAILGLSPVVSIDDAVPILSTLLSLAFLHAMLPVDENLVSDGACRQLLTQRPGLFELLKTVHTDTKQDYSRVTDSPLFPSLVSAAAKSRLHGMRAYIHEAAQNDDLFPRWIPNPDMYSGPILQDDARFQHHFDTLHLRKFSEGSSDFRIILHDLGRFIRDPVLSVRLERTFSPTDKLLLNAPGTGKTRLCYEGLCSNWGFYFTFEVNDSRLGSTDLQLAFRAYYDAFDPEIDENIRLRPFHVVLLTRLLAFQSFLEAIDASETLTDRHKIRWLEIQLAPYFEADIYASLASSLLQNDGSNIKVHIADALRKVRNAIGIDAALFIVLDDAQLATVFDIREEKPLLQDIVLSWKALTQGSFTFLCAGTPVPQSTLARDLGFHQTTETGGFDDPDTHEAYIRQFLPPMLRDSPSGRFLVARLWRWCRGRYRITDTFISILLFEGLGCPHACLTHFIRKSTGLKPLDAVKVVYEEALAQDFLWVFPKYKTFDFSEISPDHKDLIVGILYKYMATRQCHHFNTGEHLGLVTEGYVRFQDASLSQIIFNEPLFLVDAARQLFPFPVRSERGQPHRYPSTFIGSLRLNPPRTRQSLAYCLAFYLTQIFSEPRSLPDTFSFPHVVPAWARQTGQLVRLFLDEKSNLHHEVVLPEAYESLTPLATTTTTLDETTRWINHEYGTTFCIPSSPNIDLLYALRLADKSFIWVAVRVFATDEPVMDCDLRPAISLLDIDSLFVETSADALASRRAADGLRSFPGVRQRPCVLRAISSFPVEVDLRTSVDKRSRDVVKLSLTKLRRQEHQVMQEEFFGAIVNGVIAKVEVG
ncbi:hypothetical protein MIND_00876100 [Mycena indigotica]|uniref:Uncharacterized protein n=1 Tax=Mycena indigotica TaxID=2126181 RepID=A0A8H6W4U0_9AGAR|nr:uncharacterized protein MIND_00876100 [Mycena indigotica]KAF7299274.1 hypothetical protein MIND_00876100 [Mycena indigotica]